MNKFKLLYGTQRGGGVYNLIPYIAGQCHLQSWHGQGLSWNQTPESHVTGPKLLPKEICEKLKFAVKYGFSQHHKIDTSIYRLKRKQIGKSRSVTSVYFPVRTLCTLNYRQIRDSSRKIQSLGHVGSILLWPKYEVSNNTNCRYASSPLSDPENKGQRQQGVNFDTIGSWNNRISMPIMVKESIKMGKLIPEIPLDEVGTATLLGRRRVNEDKFVVTRLSPSILYFGIFDGHGGSLAADFVSDHLINHLTFWLQKTDDMSEVLRQSFIDINNLLSRHLHYYFMDSNQYNTGTTATVCLLRHGIELFIGHVGDTRAILSREGRPIRLTEDHHPDNYTEKERIHKKGGIVTSNSLGVHQVDGRLSMTRSIGDITLKCHGVMARPHLKSITLKHGKDAFLILTTDGLSFVLSDQEVVDIVSSCSKPQDAATFITDQALQFGTEDNTTSVVIPLGAWGKYRNTTRAIPYSIGRNLVGGRFG